MLTPDEHVMGSLLLGERELERWIQLTLSLNAKKQPDPGDAKEAFAYALASSLLE